MSRIDASEEAREPPHPMVPRPTLIDALRDVMTIRAAVGTAVVFLVGIGIICVSYATWFEDQASNWVTFAVREIGAGLLVAAIASVMLGIFVERYRERLSTRLEGFLRDDITADLGSIRQDINRQAALLVTASHTLEALGRTGVVKAFPSRGDAVPAMLHDSEDQDLHSISIMGISLNDFLKRDQQDSLHSVWRVINGYIDGSRSAGGRLHIRVLIIDPNCEGALLRSYGESRREDQLAGRLDGDVSATARRLGHLAKECAQRGDNSQVSFDFRLYRLPPTLFLFATNSVSYVQPYYFWSRRQYSISMPLLRLEGSPLHTAMQDHFNLIWDEASVDGGSWLEASNVGIDLGALEAGIENVFSDSSVAYNRMCWLIDHANDRIWIQGVSLKSFFVPGLLRAALHRAMERGIDIRLLLLDPECEQAQYRSFREHQFANHCPRSFATYEEYCAQPACHLASTLARDTGESLRSIEGVLRDFPKTAAHVYRSAPSCFVLIADDKVMLEQYHYGKAVPTEYVAEQRTPPILGKDMALIEFSRTTERKFLDPKSFDVSRNSFQLLADHFNFVFEHCSEPVLPSGHV